MKEWTKAIPESVDAYLAAIPKDARTALQRLRKCIRAAAPQATEVIRYRMPMFHHHGGLVAMAAFDNHCSFYVMSSTLLKAHPEVLKRYDTSAGTIRFSAGKPLPAALVTKLVKARVRENEARLRSRR